MPFTTWLPAVVTDAAWLSAGLILGATLVAVWQRLHARREARLAEWDPY